MFLPQWLTASSPGHGVHKEKVIVGRARVLSIVHVFLLCGILDVFNNELHLFTQVGLSLEHRKSQEDKFRKSVKKNVSKVNQRWFHYMLNVLVTVNCTSLTEKRHSLSWRSSTSLTSTHMLLLVGACQAPASVPRPGRHGRTLLANCRHSGQVNSPLSTEKPWRTWSFWGEMGWKMLKLSGTMITLQRKIWWIPVLMQAGHR